MRRYYNKARLLATSSTAKDTYILFGGNLLSAFLGFLFTLFAARGLSIAVFGIFSAINNLVYIISSVSDIGVSAGLVKFVASFNAKGNRKAAREYIKASLIVRLITVAALSILVIVFAPYVTQKFLAIDNVSVAYWVVALSVGLLFSAFFPLILQAYKRFTSSVIVDMVFGATRVITLFLLLALGGLTLGKVLGSFMVGMVAAGLAGFLLVGKKFLKSSPKKIVYSKLLRFSGWVGVNRVISSISGRLDIQMLAVISGATVTGVYSISSRLALFLVVLTSSFSAVLAPRLSAYEDKEKEKRYIVKATLAIIPMVIGIVVWIAFAEPFILILFGEKYISAVPVFRALAAGMIPFLLTAPSVSAIIYAMKKPVYIGAFSFFQLAAIFLLNLMLIPKYGPLGPTITFGFVHIVLAIYTWVIVIRYYWLDK